MKPKEKIRLIIIFYIASAFVFMLFGNEIIKLDQQLFLQINQISNPTLDTFFLFVTFGGAGIFWLLAIAAFWLRNHKKTSVLLLVAWFVDTMTLFGLKIFFDRPRPQETFPNVKVLDYDLGKSFPSGHSEMVFTGATILSFIYKKYRLVLYSLAALVAVSRIFVGVHFPLDVIYGSVNGILIGTLVRNLNVEDLKRRIENFI